MLTMTTPEIGAFLDQQETGVLSVCADGEAYGTPESFGYRNGRIYFQLAMLPDSRKRAFLDETDTVCFTVCDASTSRDFASVVARGSLDRLDEDSEEATLALGANEQFPSSHVFPEHEPEAIEEYVLEIEEITGKKGPDFEVAEAAPQIPVVEGSDAETANTD